MKNKFYVTTPIYYPNDIPHLGHAYTTIAADVLARWNKLLENEVFFLTGTDEHGKKLAEAAEKAKLKPKEFVDKIVPEFKEAWKKLNIEYDRFIRTTDKDHEKIVQEVLQKVYDSGDIYLGEYEGYYCTSCEAYYTEKDAPELKCPIHKKSLELLKEPSYFFRLSKYQDFLLNYYKENPDFIQPKKRANEIINRVKEGLKDLSISRTSFDWGIPLPFDKKHITFVWFDALLNYYSATQKGKEEFWPADVHIIGKDILWFHAVYWPAMLKAAKIKLPKKIFAHGWWTVNSEKMGKSAGNAIKIDQLINFAGVDPARYFLLREAPFGDDGDFSEQSLKDRYNNELGNKLGNLVSRTSSLAEKYGLEKVKIRGLDQKWKKALEDDKVEYEDISRRINSESDPIRMLKIKDEFLERERGLDALILNYPQAINEVAKIFVKRYLESLQFDKALNIIFSCLDTCNEFIQLRKPWEDSTPLDYKKWVLGEVANAIKDISILLSPFMPSTSEKIADIFNFEISLKGLEEPLKISKIKKASPLFTKL